MTRLLACGDLHLGAGVDYGRAPGDRLRDQQQVWQNILDLAVAEQVDAVLLAGDAFHRRRPTPAEMVAFQQPLQSLFADHGIEVLAICGNHDVEAAELPSALDVFGRELDLHTKPCIWRAPDRVEQRMSQIVSVATLPWTPAVARLVARTDGGDRDVVDETAADLLIRAARDLRAQIDGPAVLMLHWSVSGASTPTGMLTDDFRETLLDADALVALGYDAIVCGHIHKAQSFETLTGWASVEEDDSLFKMPFFYTGSPAPVDFGEASTPHGVWILDVAEGRCDARFMPVESRPFVTVDVDLTAPDPADLGLDEMDTIAVAIAARLPLDDAVVRVRYRADEAQARRVDQAALRQLLVDAGVHKVFAFQPDIVRANRARVEHVDDDLTPAAAAGIWADTVELAEADRDQLLAQTARYLQELGA